MTLFGRPAAIATILCAAHCACGAYAEAPVITEIRIEQLAPVLPDSEFVRDYLQVRAGDELDLRGIERDVKVLMDSGRFSFVDSRLTRTGNDVILTYVVQQKLRLYAPVTVSGSIDMGADKVREWLGLNVGDTVDDASMAGRTRNVLEEYRKRYYPSADAAWAIEANASNGTATVTLRVKENQRAKLKKFYFKDDSGVRDKAPRKALTHRFAGGLAISQRDLRKALSHRVWKPLLSWMTGSGTYNRDDLEDDREVIRRLFLDRGFLEARVGSPDVSYRGKVMLVASYPVRQGREFRVGNISLSGITLFPTNDLAGLLTLRPGDLASLAAIEKNANALQNYYAARGYIRASVRHNVSTRTNEPTADVNFRFTEGSLIHLRYVDITGNTRTRDEVIRREILVHPGEVYDVVKAKRSERVLQNLGFFSTVTSFPMATDDPRQDDIIYEVDEAQTGNFTIGAGYSSIDDIIGFIELSQGNFDLMGFPYFTGGGQKLRLRAQLGTERADYQISFVEPWFLGRRLSLGLDFYHHTMEYLSDEYNMRQTGGSVTFGKAFPWFFDRVELKYSLDRYNVYDLSSNAPPLIIREDGITTASKLNLAFKYDSRDRPFIPTQGTRFSIGAFVSGGPLGFDAQDYGFEFSSATFFPLWFDHVLSVRGWAEMVEEYGGDEDVHLFDRLFLGGAQTMRGFKYRHVGPIDAATGEPLGGKSGAMAQFEYTIPVVNMFRVAGFYDIGNVWANPYEFDLWDYCTDIGLGVRLDFPAFPIRIDYAWPLKMPGDLYRTNPRFNFTMGYDF